MKYNNKGFTLVELLAAIILLAIVAGFGTYAITHIIKSSKEKNYQLLVKNIKDAAGVYYQECRYERKASVTGEYEGAICEVTPSNFQIDGYTIPLRALVQQGYLVGNAKNETTGEYILVDPRTNNGIGDCYIAVGYIRGGSKDEVKVYSDGSSGCPQDTDYSG